jgi:ketosteroid isomerase-like protein
MNVRLLVGLRISDERVEQIPGNDPLQIVRDSYQAFAAGDRSFFEEHLSDDFSFSSPPDPKLDRDGYFERCWPGAGRAQEFDFVRLIESGNEVIVTYEMRRPDGSAGRNTEVLTFDDDKISRVEVYFGWDL